MKRPRLVSKGSLRRIFQAATESWQNRDFQQAIELLERASRLDPADSGILLDLGHMYGKRYDYAAAERCFEKAVRIAPRQTDVLAIAGKQCLNFASYEMARRYFERTLNQKDCSPEILVQLAEIYERLNRRDEAAVVVDRALQLQRNFAPALLVQAKLNYQRGQLEKAEELIRSFLAAAEPRLRVRGWYELGAILDRQGRYDEAMAAYLEAKTLLRPDAAKYTADLQISRARIRELGANASAEVLQRWFNQGKTSHSPRRLALLCGHPRSGTTLLEQVLDAHPDIVSAEETEIFFNDAFYPLTCGFTKDAPMLSILESAQAGALEHSRESYFRCMDMSLGNSIGNRLLIDKNPSLTFLIPALIRIFPEIKFLVALRDPRDVVLSCFMQPLPLWQVSSAFLSLEGTVEEYSSLMNIWRTVAPRMQNPHIEVRYEDMVEDLESTAKRVLGFLDVPWDPCVLRFNEHARQKTVRSPTYADVAKPVFKRAVGRWRNYQKYLEPHLEKLGPFVKAFGYE